jgi:hypothetical protein
MSDGDVAFETLIYTDCVPGQGLQGTAGLQFQAKSPGADRAAMNLVQQTALYEPPPRWMRERRPVAEYPPSLAHTFDGLYVTAAGVYLGREANGGREGNQLTHAIVTADPESYQLQRPAQLGGAPFWTTTAADGTQCPPVRHPWEPGPFDIEAAQSFVADHPGGADLLERLLTCLLAVGRSGSRRILFIGEDAAEVLRWISAGTLLIPHRQALAIGFKVFTTNPAYAAQPVVAVHPDWDSTAVTVDDDGGYAVFDLAHARFSKVEVDEDARRLVRLLHDEDPYDVLDVVELAAASGRADAAEAFELARSMVLSKPALSQQGARIAVSWLRATPPTLLTPSRGVLVDKLTGAIEDWPEDVLLGLDEVARSGQIDEDRMAPVRIALVHAELERAARTGKAADLPLPALPDGVWRAVHRRECEQLVLEALASCRDARAIDAVLRVAGRFGLSPDLDQVPGATRALVQDWADDPNAYSADAWGESRDVLVAALQAELTRRVCAGAADEVGDLWRIRLTASVPLPSRPLDAALLAAEMRYRDDAGRSGLVRQMLGAALTDPNPGDVVDRTVEALWRRTEPTAAEYLLLTEVLPPGTVLRDKLFEPLMRAVVPGPQQLTRDDVSLLRRLTEYGLMQPTERVERLFLDDSRLAILSANLPAAEPQTVAAYADELAAVSEKARRLWGDALVAALLAAQHPGGVTDIVRQLPAEFRRKYVSQLFDTVRKAGPAVSVAVLFDLAGVSWLTPQTTGRCMDMVRHWVAKANDKRRQQATAFIEQIATKPRQREWAALLHERENRSWTNRLRHRKAGG